MQRPGGACPSWQSGECAWGGTGLCSQGLPVHAAACSLGIPGACGDFLQPSLDVEHNGQLAELEYLCKGDQGGQRVTQPTQLHPVA